LGDNGLSAEIERGARTLRAFLAGYHPFELRHRREIYRGMPEVLVEFVEIVPWATRALARGIELVTEDRVTFAVRKDVAARLQDALAAGDRPTAETDELSILFRRPASEFGAPQSSWRGSERRP
jgi:hypothetical protein